MKFSQIDRIDAESKVTGKAKYPGDFYFEDQLHLKVLFSTKPHAVVVEVDCTRAMQFPGVLTILTAKDVPNNEYGLIYPDQPVLCGPGSNNLYADRVRFVGDQIALVIAETEDAAEKAIKLIDVKYEELPIVSDPFEAQKTDAPLLHPARGTNIFCQYKIRKGDVEEAFSNSDVTVECDYITPVQEHAYLQPEAGVGYLDEDDRITIIVGGQWTHEDQEQIAHSLNIEKERVRVIYPAIGGAFGGREDMSVQIILALAVMKLKEMGIRRPIKTVWTREESIIGHHKRHAYHFHAKWGATRGGKLIAAQVEALTDGGAYMYTSTKVMANATLMCTGPYDIPNVSVDSKAVYTNNIPGGAFRGFGGPQAAFVAECQMNKLAEKLGIDPVTLRLLNVLRDEIPLSVGTLLPAGVSLDKVIERCAETAGWKRNPDNLYSRPKLTHEGRIKRGFGFACSFKNVGFSFGAPENCWAGIELYGKAKIERAILKHAGAEVGQGSHTVFLQMAAHALNIPVDLIECQLSDTATSKNSGSVSASRMTFMAGNAIKGAAELALTKWTNEERPAISEFKYLAPKTTPFDPETGQCYPNFAYGYVAEAVDCELDIETGIIHINKVVCVDDVGHAVNPVMIEGQVEGAIVQAVGYGINENFIQKSGKVITDKFSTYLIPTVFDVPDQVETVIMETADKNGPWGIKGMGEMPYLPLVPALIDAIHNATGVWFNEFPLTPERVFYGLRTSGIKKQKG